MELRRLLTARRLLTGGLWLSTTVAATILVWTATSFVARDVTDRPAPVVAHRDIVIALAGGDSPVAPTTVAPPASPGQTAITSPQRPGLAKSAPATAGPQPPPPTTRPSQPVAPAQTPVVAAPAPSAQPRGGAVTTVPRPAPTQAPPATATYSTRGGLVTVVCTGQYTIRMVSASPSDGYQVDSNVNSGPFVVEVHFIGHDDDVSVKAACVFGQPFRSTDPGRPSGS